MNNFEAPSAVPMVKEDDSWCSDHGEEDKNDSNETNSSDGKSKGNLICNCYINS